MIFLIYELQLSLQNAPYYERQTKHQLEKAWHKTLNDDVSLHRQDHTETWMHLPLCYHFGIHKIGITPSVV